LDAPNVELFTGDAPNRTTIANTFSSELLSFAKDTSVSWPEFDLDNRSTLQIDLDTKVINNPEPEIRELWSAKI
jgi:carboxylesterase type B